MASRDLRIADRTPSANPAEGLEAELGINEYLPTPRHLTGVGNAERFVEQHNLDVRFVYPWKKWIVWNLQRFAPDETGKSFGAPRRPLPASMRKPRPRIMQTGGRRWPHGPLDRRVRPICAR